MCVKRAINNYFIKLIEILVFNEKLLYSDHVTT